MKNLQFYKQHFTILILLIIAIAIKVFSLFPSAVEQYYSNGIYPYISLTQRLLTGWIPVSIGDLMYAAAFFWLFRQVILLFRKIKKKERASIVIPLAVLKLIRVLLVVYVLFNGLWGLNYNRQGLEHQLQLEMFDYDDKDLETLTTELAGKLNSLQPASLKTRESLHSKRALFDGAIYAYKQLAGSLPFISYPVPSVKPSIYSYLGNYLGFTGYYNPFSGEAQVNTTVPVYVRPFTTCHEIGHQLGYAKESEANFAGFLSASRSNDSSFLYSLYFDMYAYAARYLYVTDSNALKKINNSLSVPVRKDISDLRAFYRKYSTPVETAIDKMYSEYLKANEQPSGKMSYNEVISMLIAYRRKYGRI